MGKLSKEAAKAHREADALTRLERDLTEDERLFVLEHWQESADTASVLDGAFFTPMELATEVAHHVHGDRIIDLCAGTGRLAYAARRYWGNALHLIDRELTCVEANPEYVRVGRKVLPEARWIQADVIDILTLSLGTFDAAISNPPFGRIKRSGNAPRYRGPLFELHVMDIAAHLAPTGAHVLPQQSTPFRYSGRVQSSRETLPELARFERETGMTMWFNYGVDTAQWHGEWHGVAPSVEIACHNVEEDRLQQEAELAEKTRALAPATAPRPVDTGRYADLLRIA